MAKQSDIELQNSGRCKLRAQYDRARCLVSRLLRGLVRIEEGTKGGSTCWRGRKIFVGMASQLLGSGQLTPRLKDQGAFRGQASCSYRIQSQDGWTSSRQTGEAARGVELGGTLFDFERSF